MKKIIEWIKQNKLAAILILIVAFLILKNQTRAFYGISSFSSPVTRTSETMDYGVSNQSLKMESLSMPSSAGYAKNIAYVPEAAPSISDSRMVVSTSHLSLLVKDVKASLAQVKSYAENLGGYMVNSNITRPEEGATGTITLRIPSIKLEEILEYYRNLSVKVISENLEGTDVTDQYIDNNARLEILEKNKARFEQIMEEAKNIDEILRVQNQIFSLQSQIDSIKGQQQYLEKTATMAKITIYLSTDELSLPYAPADTWSPKVIFKRAVRSLTSTLRSLGSVAIWLVVYSVVIIPVIIIFSVIKRIINKRKEPKFK